MKISIPSKTQIARAIAFIMTLALVLGAALYPIATHAKTTSDSFECTIKNVEKTLDEIEEKIDALDIDEMSIGELIDELSDIDLMLKNLKKCVDAL